MRTVKALLLAPLAPLAVIYLWTIAHFDMPYAAIGLIHPFMWFLAVLFGLPALYVAELALGLPIHYLLERTGWNGRGAYAICGAAIGATACLIWSSILRAGPLPLHHEVVPMMTVGVASGAIGGITFRKIAAGGKDDTPPLPAKSLLIVVSPLIVLYALVYALVGHHYAWREWVALPMADPGGFGLFTVIAIVLAIALAIDQWKRRGAPPVTRA